MRAVAERRDLSRSVATDRRCRGPLWTVAICRDLSRTIAGVADPCGLSQTIAGCRGLLRQIAAVLQTVADCCGLSHYCRELSRTVADCCGLLWTVDCCGLSQVSQNCETVPDVTRTGSHPQRAVWPRDRRGCARALRSVKVEFFLVAMRCQSKHTVIFS